MPKMWCEQDNSIAMQCKASQIKDFLLCHYFHSKKPKGKACAREIDDFIYYSAGAITKSEFKDLLELLIYIYDTLPEEKRHTTLDVATDICKQRGMDIFIRNGIKIEKDFALFNDYQSATKTFIKKATRWED